MNILSEVMAALQHKNYAQAESLLKTGLQQAPTHIGLHECAILFYGRTQRMDEALFHAETGIQLMPHAALFWNHKGNLLYRLNRIEDALEAYQSALEYDSQSADAMSNAALCYVQLNNNEQARACFEMALRIKPDHFTNLFNLGLLYRENKEHKKAQYCFLKCMELQPEQYDAYYQMAIISMERRHHEEAEGYFLKALGLAPKVFALHFDYATLLHQQNRKEEALQYYHHVLQLNPTHEAARFMVAALTGQQTVAQAPNLYLEMLFNQYAPHYDHHLEKILKYQVPQLMSETLQKVADAEGMILDLGCGTGLCGPLLKPHAKTLIGIDLSAEMIKAAASRACYDHLITGDAVSELTQYPHYFDTIVAADVLIYFGDLLPILKVVSDSLKPNGHFVFTVEREEDDAPGYVLNQSGRFKHSLAYIKATAEAAKFSEIEIKEVISRYQDHEPVLAYLVVLRSPFTINR